jgi:hypothetical protein
MFRKLSGAMIMGLLMLSPSWGRENPPTSQPVSRQEFEEMKKDNAEMKQELNDIKKQQADQAANADQDAEDTEHAIKQVENKVQTALPGLDGFVLAGDAAIGFQTQKGTHSTFFADVSPLILWQAPDPHLLVEAAFDLAIGGDGETQASESASLEVNLADISYTFGDYLVLGGGLFAVPFGQYHNHFDPPWINKFPDDPLAFDAIAPISEVGFFAKGVIPSGTTKWTWDAYAANGPNLITDDPNTAGQLNFDDFTDINNNKAVGGRIGFLPLPDMEMGYSVQYSDPNPDNFQRVHAFLQAADFRWKPVVKKLGGQFDLGAEWIWSNVSQATYDPTGSLGFGPTTFTNFRQGGYAAFGYRPTEAGKIIRDLEFLTRFDSLQSNLASPGGDHEYRWTFGVDYWLTSYCVFKTAYELDHKEVGENQNAFIFQVGYGL